MLKTKKMNRSKFCHYYKNSLDFISDIVKFDVNENKNEKDKAKNENERCQFF